jgi:2-amino-4-hydroxy-6-hydroxymethyldihydropteridine diphosphokinase
MEQGSRRTAFRRVYLALGSNLGDREAALREAVAGLREGGVSIDAASSLYETPPWGPGLPGLRRQPRYLNAAVGGSTDMTARDLLGLAKRLEAGAGRDVRAPKWSPRPLDVDVALIEGEAVEEPDLVVPHALLAERSFVLVPLAEIAAEVVHPRIGLRIGTLRDLRPGLERQEVRRVRGPEWVEG